jgi:catechol 2,3-dioxygenase-like lactoylglutathione lyase family enzyme
LVVTPARRELVSLLVERGARHHIFSAMAMGDLLLIRTVVEQNPEAIDRRMSRFEQGQTPLHFAINRKRYDILDLLIDLGADLEAKDNSGQTALAVAMLRGDDEAMRRLHAAGARKPKAVARSSFTESMARLASSVKKGVPMISVPDVAKALEWYVSIGFKELTRFDDDGEVNFGMVSFGGAELMFNLYGTHGRDVSLWFYTDKIDKLYQLLKSRQLAAATAALSGKSVPHQAIVFEQDIENMFYGARQFAIKDLNGFSLLFIQSIDE